MYNCNCCKKIRKFTPHYIYIKQKTHILVTPDERDDSDLEPAAILCPKCFKIFINNLVSNNMVREDIYADGLLI